MQATPTSNSTQRALQEIWEDVLGISPVEPGDRFVDLGGTSLRAEKVMILVRQRFAMELTPEILAGTPTLSEIAQRIEAHRRPQFRARATTMTRLATAPATSVGPVFCLAGAGASAVAFIPLAQAVGHERGVYAFHQRGFFARALPDWTVEAHARRHLRDIRRVQPRGPYTLVGHSFGGLVALEIANRLVAAGETVDRLLLLDSVLPDARVSVADIDAVPTTQPSLRARLGTHARILTAGIVHRDADTQQSIFWEHGVRAQNRYVVRTVPDTTIALVTQQNRMQRPLWETHLGADRVIRVAGDHLAILSGMDQVATISKLVLAE